MYRRLISNGGCLTPSSRPGIKPNRSCCARHILGAVLQAVKKNIQGNSLMSLRYDFDTAQWGAFHQFEVLEKPK